jgi:hypothetical protein
VNKPKLFHVMAFVLIGLGLAWLHRPNSGVITLVTHHWGLGFQLLFILFPIVWGCVLLALPRPNTIMSIIGGLPIITYALLTFIFIWGTEFSYATGILQWGIVFTVWVRIYEVEYVDTGFVPARFVHKFLRMGTVAGFILILLAFDAFKVLDTETFRAIHRLFRIGGYAYGVIYLVCGVILIFAQPKGDKYLACHIPLLFVALLSVFRVLSSEDTTLAPVATYLGYTAVLIANTLMIDFDELPKGVTNGRNTDSRSHPH